MMASEIIDLPHRYFIINKPRNMVSQFVSSHKVRLLGDLEFPFPEGTHAIGRLDKDSEGLLILTTDKKITRLLFSREVKHKRIYLVQVSGTVNQDSLHLLKTGVPIRIEGGKIYTTPVCDVKIINDPKTIYPLTVLTEEHGKHTWMLMTLYEGKYRQVRKMVGAVHHRCKRLIRISIEDLLLDNLPPGGVRQIEESDFLEKLKIKKH
ncbi:MAG: pseudouridine synthase [Ginsengibacter sp.]